MGETRHHRQLHPDGQVAGKTQNRGSDNAQRAGNFRCGPGGIVRKGSGDVSVVANRDATRSGICFGTRHTPILSRRKDYCVTVSVNWPAWLKLPDVAVTVTV